MNIFLVGGAVRDELLGYPFHERDWVVTQSSPQTMLDLGYQQVGKDFPVFLHPETREEYALARKERKTGHGYTGFEFDTHGQVTLEEDLARRDLTINAIAKDETGDFIDPYHGRADIENRLLRHVTDAFCEDPVRILRVARFFARYSHLGFQVADETFSLMKSMVANGEVDHLVAERVWAETHKALGEQSPHQYFALLHECGALAVIMPEIDALFGVPQTKLYHPEVDTGLHTLLSLAKAASLSESRIVRFATLVHDLGKALTPKDKLPSHHGHEKSGLTPVRNLCERLQVPNQYRDLALLVCEFHLHSHRATELKASTLNSVFERMDAFRKPERIEQFVICCQADTQGRTGWEERPYPQADYIRQAFTIAQKVQAKAFVEAGMKGKEIGDAITRERTRLINLYKQDYKKK